MLTTQDRLHQEVEFWRKTLEIVGDKATPAEATRIFKALASAEQRLKQHERSE